MSFTFDIPTFRAMYGFTCTNTYPDAVLNGFFAQAEGFVANTSSPGYCFGLQDSQLGVILSLLTAHLAYVQNAVNTGGGGIVQSATIDKVSVTLRTPESKDSWAYFLNQSPYGIQLQAYLSLISVGGFYTGGSLDRQGLTQSNYPFYPYGLF